MRPHQDIRPHRATMKDDLARRIAEVGTVEFLRDARGLPADMTGSALDDVEVETLQNDGTGPATVAYRLAGAPRLIAKLFFDASGTHSHATLKTLWQAGFDDTQRYRVSQPFGFVPDLNMMLIRYAPGRCLDDYLLEDGDAPLEGVRESARWLARLHGSPVRFGTPEQPWYIFLKLADRLSKASSKHPGDLKFFTGLSMRLRRLGEDRKDVPLVQTHGQYRPIHVYIADEAVTVIDLDRSAPADPARDVAEYVHRMRSTVHRTGGSRERADALTAAFLKEYASLAPRNLGNLPFYMGFLVLVSLCRHAKKLERDDAQWEAVMGHYLAEYDDALSGKHLD